MIVHVIGSIRQLDDDILRIQTIIDTLHLKGIYLAHDWLTGVKSRKERQTKPENALDWQLIVNENFKAITTSDALIVENSHYNYSNAYQTAIALAHNKPVLNLYRTNTLEYKEWPDKLFVSGIDNPLFHSLTYNKAEDLPKIIDKFLSDITPKVIPFDVKISLDPTSASLLSKRTKELDVSINTLIKDLILQEFDKLS